MNGDPNATISEHAFGNALDIAAFTFADGRKIDVEHGWRGSPEEQAFLHDVQASACDQFRPCGTGAMAITTIISTLI